MNHQNTNESVDAIQQNTIPNNISQLVANNLSRTTIMQPGHKAHDSPANWYNLLKLTLIFIGVNNCYWITIYNVTYLDGNKFVNGIILGIAELLSGVFAGFLISKTSPSIAFHICAALAIAFNAFNQFLVPVGSLASYMTLFIAILGVGGVYTAIYVLIYIVVPKEQVGGAMVLIVTIGTSLSLFAPIIVLYASPVPYLALTAMMLMSALMVCFLPRECPDTVKD